MRNLVEITCDDIDIFENIANSKRSPRKELLLSLVDTINSCYHQYTENTYSLEILTPHFDLEDAEKRDGLLHCYEMQTTELNKLKKTIHESQPKEIRGICQLCGIDSPATFDHYLPKGTFPEFSVFSKNMVPCCHVCNHDKGSTWIENGNRKILNMYFDLIPEDIFLIAKIILEDDIPVVYFEIIDESINEETADLIKNHFITLNLFDRYKSRSNHVLSSIKNSIQAHGLANSSMNDIKSWLREEACAIRECDGFNDWKASIYDALAECETCINNISNGP